MAQYGDISLVLLLARLCSKSQSHAAIAIYYTGEQASPIMQGVGVVRDRPVVSRVRLCVPVLP